MNCSTDTSLSGATAVVCILLTLFAATPQTAHAQESRIRLGLHSGMQSSVLRYTVAPYTGTFQSTIDEGAVHGVSACVDLSTAISLMLDIEWKNDAWAEVRGEDPLIEIEMARRSTLQVPLLLRYRLHYGPLPFYVAAGAALAVTPDASGRFELSYKGFSEREGWRSYSFSYDQTGTTVFAVAEAGLDVDLGASLSMLLAARYQSHMTDLMSGEAFSAQVLSVWRLRAAFYVSL